MARKFVGIPQQPPERKVGRPPVYYPELEAVKDENPPKVWVLLAEYQSLTGGRDAMTRILSGRTQIPAGLWEFHADKDTERGTSSLYVRWFEDIEGQK